MITVNLKELLKAVKTAGLAADAKTSMPLLSCVQLKASDGVLTVRATDLTTDISVLLFADGDLDTCVPAKQLASLLATCLPKGKRNGDVKVDLSTDENHLIIGAGVAMKLVTMPATDYPKAPHVDPDPIAYNVKAFGDALDFIGLATSTDETRYHLNGLCFDGQNMISTDGHRLHKQSEMPDVGGNYIVPRRSALTLRKVLTAYGDETTIGGFEAGYATFTAGMATVYCKLIEAQFPPYSQVIWQGDGEVIAEVNRASFLSAIRQASMLSSDRTYGVKISLDPNGCNVEADNPDLGTASAPFTVDVRIETPFKAGFNAKYILDFLECMASDKVTLRFNGVLDPLKVEDGNRLSITMPMRI